MNCEILLQSCKAFLTSLKGASEKFCDMCGEYLADSSSEMETPSPSQGHLSMHLFHPSPSKIPSSSSTLPRSAGLGFSTFPPGARKHDPAIPSPLASFQTPCPPLLSQKLLESPGQLQTIRHPVSSSHPLVGYEVPW